MAAMSPECNLAVLRVHYQLAAAHTRADEGAPEAYWKRADALCGHLIDEAVQALRSGDSD